MPVTATTVEGLRQGWEDALAALPTPVHELPVLLERRIAEAVTEDHLDESSLLAIVEEARATAAARAGDTAARRLSRRMQRAVYEFLLSLDAVAEPRHESDDDDVGRPLPKGAMLIGMEEVAQLGLATPLDDPDESFDDPVDAAPEPARWSPSVESEEEPPSAFEDIAAFDQDLAADEPAWTPAPLDLLSGDVTDLQVETPDLVATEPEAAELPPSLGSLDDVDAGLDEADELQALLIEREETSPVRALGALARDDDFEEPEAAVEEPATHLAEIVPLPVAEPDVAPPAPEDATPEMELLAPEDVTPQFELLAAETVPEEAATEAELLAPESATDDVPVASAEEPAPEVFGEIAFKAAADTRMEASEQPDAPAAPPRRRFTLFRRSGPRPLADETNAAVDAPDLAAAAPAPETEGDDAQPAASFSEPEPAAPEPEGSPPEPAAPEAPATEPAAQELEPPAASAFIAPRDGFHITEFSPVVAHGWANSDPLEMLVAQAAQPEAPAPTGDVAEAMAPAPVAETSSDDGQLHVIKEAAVDGTDEGEAETPMRGWRIRRMRRSKIDAVAALADDEDDEQEPELQDVPALDSESPFESDPTVVEARRQINSRLRQRRCDEAASLLQQLAVSLGGRQVADLALDAGDRCRALGKANAALSCYLAASRADPEHEQPLLRLADICINEKDIDLAVKYLERVAMLHRKRDNKKSALRVYRKIITVAPYRQDIQNLLMHVQASGRFPDS